MRASSRWLRGVSLGAILCAAAESGSAATLDWDVVGWPGIGTLSNTFVDVDGSGVDISVSITDSTPGSLVLSDAPDVNNDFTPPGSSGEDLFIRTTGNPFGSGVTLQVSFSGVGILGASAVSFGLFDVDDDAGTQWVDVMTLQGAAVGGGSVLPTSVTAANATPSWVYDGIGGVLTGTASSASNSDNGTVVVTFAAPITGFTIFYENGDSAPGSPAGNQWIGLGDLSFEPVAPEPAIGALLAPGLLVLARRYAAVRRGAGAGR